MAQRAPRSFRDSPPPVTAPPSRGPPPPVPAPRSRGAPPLAEPVSLEAWCDSLEPGLSALVAGPIRSCGFASVSDLLRVTEDDIFEVRSAILSAGGVSWAQVDNVAGALTAMQVMSR